MKKQQKIIELRTAAKLKVTEIETKIAVAHSEAAKKRASLMILRADELKDTKTETERFNAIDYYRALLADIQADLAATVANLKADIQQAKAECEQKCAAAEDDHETMRENPQQTVYCDGSEHTARIVARRMINKMPHIQKGGYLFVHIIRDDNGNFFVGVSEQGEKSSGYISTVFSKDWHCEKEEAQFVEEAREMFKSDDEEASTKAAGPMSRALDALFGGNPVEQVDNLIADTVKSGKECGDE